MNSVFRDLLKLDRYPVKLFGAEVPDKGIASISIDSRTIKPGEVYFALKGENQDGHRFVQAALEKGAAAVVVSESFWHDAQAGLEGYAVFVVDDTLRALQAFANAYRRKFDLPVIALTGTNGKTTTKEMIAAVLALSGEVCKTVGNFNNHIGLPLTLFGLEEKHDFLVVEMGANHFEEITALCEIAEPQFGLITNIGHGHTEFLQDIKGVAKAKMELFHYLRHDGVVFANLDDPMIAKNAARFKNKVTYGFTDDADIVGENARMDGRGFPVMQIDGEVVRLNVAGVHNLSNALAALAVGKQFGLTVAQMREALENIHLPSKRMEVLRRGTVTILNDSYNANPESTMAALQTLSKFTAARRKIFVLGDMLELGEQATEQHARIGKALPQFHIDVFYAYGPLAAEALTAAQATGKKIIARHFEHKDDLAAALKAEMQPHDVLLIKGSRGMKMEDVLTTLFPAK
ncbi:MAG: UDP-N-acetylmuramoyl-tripeptide--D-alanyl-D-alanine ligase [Calditrichaeota bacterium]|nr:UDP-N-acetylmuramoyl-tripeptide--D-alanyl-D-alanine ligase [Calditrichota bacterium]